MELRDVAIVGVHATKQAWRLPGASPFGLTLESLDGALADAGLARADIDGVALEWYGPGGIVGEAASWARVLGHDIAWASDGQLDSAGTRGVVKAAAAIAAGLCDVAVVGGGMAGMLSAGTPVANNKFGELEFSDVWGAYVIPMFALVAARHMHEFGTTPEHLALVATTIRNLGYSNPEAVMHGKPATSIEDVLASRMVASPFHLLDCCIAAEGGGAVVLTTLERARDLRQPPVAVLAGGMQFHMAPYAYPALYREVRHLGVAAASRMFARAGVGIGDVDVLTVYDANSFEVLRQIEVLGVCGEGEGGPYVETHGIGMESPVPVNPDGGCLAYTWNGTQQQTLKVVEIVRQLRGTAVHQVDGAEVGVAVNAGTGAGHLEIAVFGRTT
jgi:acetyl-CoA acetyltransferase